MLRRPIVPERDRVELPFEPALELRNARLPAQPMQKRTLCADGIALILVVNAAFTYSPLRTVSGCVRNTGCSHEGIFLLHRLEFVRRIAASEIVNRREPG
jgi:hypothetical protein